MHAMVLKPLDAAIFFAAVANLTRQDGIDFLRLAPAFGIITKTTTYPLEKANQALADLRAGRFEGAAVLVP